MVRTPDDAFRMQLPVVPAEPVIQAPTVHVMRLESGLEAILVERPDLPMATVIYANRAAHDDATVDNIGLANLTAHVMAAAITLPGEAIDREPELDGQRPKIAVSLQGTSIALTTTSDRLSAAFLLLGGIVQRPALDPIAFGRARSDVDRQLSSHATLVRARVHRVAMRTIYEDLPPLTQSFANQKTALSRLPASAVRTFFEQRYTPALSQVIVVGGLNEHDWRALVAEEFGAWVPRIRDTRVNGPSISSIPTLPTLPTLPAPHARAPLSGRPGEVSIRGLRMGGQQAWVTIAVPCVGMIDADDVVFDVLAKLLAGGINSRVSVGLRHDDGASYWIDATCFERTSSGEFFIDFDRKADAVGQGVRLVFDEIARLSTTPVTEGELAIAKDSLLATLTERRVTNEGLAHQITTSLLYGKGPEESFARHERIRAVTVEDVQRVAAKHLVRSRMGIVVAGDPARVNAQISRFGYVAWGDE